MFFLMLQWQRHSDISYANQLFGPQYETDQNEALFYRDSVTINQTAPNKKSLSPAWDPPTCHPTLPYPTLPHPTPPTPAYLKALRPPNCLPMISPHCVPQIYHITLSKINLLTYWANVFSRKNNNNKKKKTKTKKTKKKTTTTTKKNNTLFGL